MKSELGKQQLQHIVPNISRSKHNQKMKLGSLNLVEKVFPGSFLENEN